VGILTLEFPKSVSSPNFGDGELSQPQAMKAFQLRLAQRPLVMPEKRMNLPASPTRSPTPRSPASPLTPLSPGLSARALSPPLRHGSSNVGFEHPEEGSSRSPSPVSPHSPLVDERYEERRPMTADSAPSARSTTR
jgi:hypothetical protein